MREGADKAVSTLASLANRSGHCARCSPSSVHRNDLVGVAVAAWGSRDTGRSGRIAGLRPTGLEGSADGPRGGPQYHRLLRPTRGLLSGCTRPGGPVARSRSPGDGRRLHGAGLEVCWT
jgi:hypothetical protein